MLGNAWACKDCVAKYSCVTHHLHKIFLKTKGKACLAGSITVTVVKFRVGSGLGVIQGRGIPSPGGVWAVPGASPALSAEPVQQGQATAKWVCWENCCKQNFPLFCHTVQPPFFRDTYHKISGSQERTECSKCCSFWAVPGSDPCPGALAHPELTWSKNPNFLSLAHSVGQPWLRSAEVHKNQLFILPFPCPLPPKVGKTSPRRVYFLLGGITAFWQPSSALETAGLWISEITARVRSWCM